MPKTSIFKILKTSQITISASKSMFRTIRAIIRSFLVSRLTRSVRQLFQKMKKNRHWKLQLQVQITHLSVHFQGSKLRTFLNFVSFLTSSAPGLHYVWFSRYRHFKFSSHSVFTTKSHIKGDRGVKKTVLSHRKHPQDVPHAFPSAFERF